VSISVIGVHVHLRGHHHSGWPTSAPDAVYGSLTLEATDHGDQQDLECQGALAEKGVGLEPRRLEQIVGIEEVNNVDENALVLRSTW
jgi:hypothetical protein